MLQSGGDTKKSDGAAIKLRRVDKELHWVIGAI